MEPRRPRIRSTLASLSRIHAVGRGPHGSRAVFGGPPKTFVSWLALLDGPFCASSALLEELGVGLSGGPPDRTRQRRMLPNFVGWLVNSDAHNANADYERDALKVNAAIR